MTESTVVIDIIEAPSIYTLPSNSVQQNKIFAKRYLRLCFELILIFLFLFPFTMLDLYYGDSNLECLNSSYPHTSLTMSKWLISVSYINISTFLVIFIIFLAIGCTRNRSLGLKVFKILGGILIFGLTAWTIVGSILFWKYTNYYSCSESIYKYIYSRLVIGLVFWPIDFIRIILLNI